MPLSEPSGLTVPSERRHSAGSHTIYCMYYDILLKIFYTNKSIVGMSAVA